MESDRCDMSDLLKTDCAHCRSSGKLRRTRIAEYRGTCTGCAEGIEPGDRIGLVEGNWVCSLCTREAM